MTSPDAAPGDARERAARAAFDAFYADGTPYSQIEREMFLQVADAVIEAIRATPDAGGAVTVPLDDLRAALDAMVYVQDTYFWEKWNYQEPFDRLTAIAASGGRDGGE